MPEPKQITETFPFYSMVCFTLLPVKLLPLDCTENASYFCVLLGSAGEAVPWQKAKLNMLPSFS